MSSVDQIYVRDPGNPAQRSRIQFVDLQGGTRAGFKTQYLARQDRWALWVLNLDTSVICGPILLVRGLSLLVPFQYNESVPPGTLWVSGKDMTLDNVDVGSRLLYRGPV